MKKLVLISLVLFLGLGVTAQTIGLRFGYTKSGLKISDDVSDHLDLMDKVGKLTDGVNIGFVFEKAIKPRIDLHIELNFAQKGSAYDLGANEANGGQSGYGEYNFNYFELPIMAKIKFGPAYIALGPHIGYLMGAKEIKYRENDALVSMLGSEEAAATMLGVSSLRNDEFFDMDMDFINCLDFGAQFAIGAQFPVGPVKVFGEARGTMAFTNWDNSDFFNDMEFDYKRNLAFTFSIGVLYNLQAK